MNVNDNVNVSGKQGSDITKGGIGQVAKVNTDASTEHIAKNVETKPAATVHSMHRVNTELDRIASGIRNISFKINKDTEEMYVEITNAENEVIRTIPADEGNPAFRELIQQSKPGSFIDNMS